jgi:ribosome maturation protein Sdo1
VDKALVELKIKMATMEKKEKQKAVVVSKLFAMTEMPFTKQVIDHPLPNKFKVP